jgi:hypothetical protein
MPERSSEVFDVKGPKPRTLLMLIVLLILFIVSYDGLSRSISPILVQYKGIEKWNGILPQVSGGALPLIDLGKMRGLSGGAEGGKR